MMLNLAKNNWKHVTLGDVASASKERCDPERRTVERYVAGEHMDTDDLKIHRWGVIGDGYLGPAFHRRFRQGQVLYGSRRTYLRKVAVADFDGICANTTFVVETCDRNVLLQEFLPFIMTAERFHAFAISESKGSVNPYVNWSDIARYQFVLPPLSEQKRVADLLWAMQRHRRSLQALAQHLQEDVDLILAERLDSGDGCKRWESNLISDLVTSGPSNGKSAVANDEMRGVPTLSISAVREGVVTSDNSVKYVDVPSDSVKQFLLQVDDFLIVRGNGNKQLTALGGLVGEGLPDGCIYPDLLIRLRFDASRILPEFAAIQWNSATAHDALLRHAKSTNGIWKINGKDVKAHSLVVPPLDRQREIMAAVYLLGASLRKVREEMKALDSMQMSLSLTIFGP